jgi:hypothetical protein
VRSHPAQELRRVPRASDDLVAGILQQGGDALPQQGVVVGDDDS